ncbi:MAG: DUF523 domain-containing protein [Clostridia bacterium]|nr:DUF523 domain-containing protein [Clostridia bacterium]
MKSILISACLLGIPCRYDGKSKPKIEGAILEELKKKYALIPVCPEIYGGLPTPRTGSERVGERVIMADGTDVTENYDRGAKATLDIAKTLSCSVAILKERSPSCGSSFIYDGTFTRTLKQGQGVTAELLSENGIKVFSEDEVESVLKNA